MPRWITIHTVPFDYKWPTVNAITAFTEEGEFLVKDQVADYAVGKSYATEGRSGEAKPKKATRAKKSATPAPDAATANPGPAAGVDREDLAPDDRADDSAPVADAG